MNRKKDIKIVLVGDSGVGKTHQCRQICKDDKIVLPTQLVDIHVYMDKKGNRYKIWDLSGSYNGPEEYYESCFKGMKIGVVLWRGDPTNINAWKDFIKSYVPNAPIFDVVNVKEVLEVASKLN